MKNYFFLFLITIFGWTIQAQTIGIIQNTEAAFNGYTLFAPSAAQTTYLVDNCGNVVNTWMSEYVPGASVYLLENGNLLRTCRIPSSFNGGGTGGRLELYNWDGALLWAYNYSTPNFHQHHDVEVLPNGNILLIAWDNRSEQEAIAAGRNPETINERIWSEKIVEIKPVGTEGAEIIWEWFLWDHLVQDFDSSKENFGVVENHPELMNLNYAISNLGGASVQIDWVHLNAIHYNAALDQIAVSSRHLGEIWIIDHSTTTAEAASHQGGNAGKGGDIIYRWGNPQAYNRGDETDQRFFGQHDVRWIPDGYLDAGKLMVFNNGIGRPGPDYSSVDVIDPPNNGFGYTLLENEAFGPAQIDWTYSTDPANAMFSNILSGASRLPNGNTLICAGRTGHFREVTHDGMLVWEYIVPVTGGTPDTQGNLPHANETFRATRYAPDYPAFDGLELTAGLPIELEPTNQECIIYENSSAAETAWNNLAIEIFPNPFTDQFVINNEAAKLLRVQVVDLSGQPVFETQTSDAQINIATQLWTGTIYFVVLHELNSGKTTVQKVIKTP